MSYFDFYSQQSLTTTSERNKYDFTAEQNDQNYDRTSVDDSFDKCPTCFIIFPSTMGSHERTQHVNQHFDDS